MSTTKRDSARGGRGRLVRRRLYSAGYYAGRRNTPFALIEHNPAAFISGWAAGQNYLHRQWRRNTAVTDAEPSTSADTRAQGPRSV